VTEGERSALELIGQIIPILLVLVLVDLSVARHGRLDKEVRAAFVLLACLAAVLGEGFVLGSLLTDCASPWSTGVAGGCLMALMVVLVIGFTWQALWPQRQNIDKRVAVLLAIGSGVVIAASAVLFGLAV
jgi:heme A synthase